MNPSSLPESRVPSASNPTAPIRRVVLTGFMGSGKSTIGPLLAKRLGWTFLDADDVIVSETGMPISRFFAQHGEPAFRDLEHATITRLALTDSLVLALGGGAIERAATRDFLRTAPGTLLVHLEVTLETTLARCRGTEHIRPVLADQANLARRYEHRLPLYRTAHLSIPVDALTPEQVVATILTAGNLNP